MKKLKRMKAPIFTFYILFSFLGCLHISAQSTGQIYLYGEQHGVEKILQKEVEIWGDYYNSKGMKHLFLEIPFYTSEFLNIWMNSETDDILNQIYDDWDGTASHIPPIKDFFKEIKNRFPKTIFHGTDVGHQYHSTGKRYLDYLSQQSMKKSEQYQHAKKAIDQGRHFYNNRDAAYRENMMVANFVLEFDKLENQSVMGIYGGSHTDINSMDNSDSVPSMANQLNKMYTNQLFTKNLSYLVKEIDPIKTDSIQISGSTYKALYFGRTDLTGFKDFKYREFWLIEDAYNSFKSSSKAGDFLPYSNYPMTIETGNVYVIDYMKIDGTLIRKYYRSDGNSWRNNPTTEEFVIE